MKYAGRYIINLILKIHNVEKNSGLYKVKGRCKGTLAVGTSWGRKRVSDWLLSSTTRPSSHHRAASQTISMPCYSDLAFLPSFCQLWVSESVKLAYQDFLLHYLLWYSLNNFKNQLTKKAMSFSFYRKKHLYWCTYCYIFRKGSVKALESKG